MHIFLTGPPGCGKTTVIETMLTRAPRLRVGGFRTVSVPSEIPQARYEVYIVPAAAPETCRDRRHLVGIRWQDRQRSVFPQAFETGGRELLTQPGPFDLLLMDEIGTMENKSPRFGEAILTALDAETPVCGVIKPQSSLLLDAIRQHPSTLIIEVPNANRERLPEELFSLLFI